MDVLSIVRAVWRHKILALPVLLITIAGTVYVVALQRPVYQMTVNYALVFPPDRPSPSDIARDPSLATTSSDNPYTRFADQAVVVDIVTSRVSGDTQRSSLEAQGASKNYTVGPSVSFGSPTPIAQVVGVGPTPAAAKKTATLVGAALDSTLTSLQRDQGVADYYLIRALPVDSSGPRLQVSGKLRSLLAVVGGGVLLVFIVVSVGDALDAVGSERKGRRHGRATRSGKTGGNTISPIDESTDATRLVLPAWTDLREAAALSALSAASLTGDGTQ